MIKIEVNGQIAGCNFSGNYLDFIRDSRRVMTLIFGSVGEMVIERKDGSRVPTSTLQDMWKDEMLKHLMHIEDDKKETIFSFNGSEASEIFRGKMDDFTKERKEGET